MKIFDSTYPVIQKHYSFVGKNREQNLKRNTYIGTAAGILASGLLLTKGNLKKLPKIEYGIKEVMLVCTGSAVGGYIGANTATSENKEGRKLELKNQLVYNDLLPLVAMEIVDKTFKTSNKFLKSMVLAGSLLVSTFAGHELAEKSLKRKGLKTDYPVEAAHILAEFDDYLLPIAVATKWKWLQNFLKVISPVTFFPLGLSVGKVKDEKYFV